MPDPTRKTISATQAPALWNVSPYMTRWMLHKHFAEGMVIDQPAGDGRMQWGRKLQPLVLDQAARDLALEVRSNEADVYLRRGLLGCTRDAEIYSPDRGPGALETKCVFDFGIWMREWDGGKHIPRHHEIQLQQQMLIGDEKKPFAWGTIAVWVCGEMHYYDREPIPDLVAGLEAEAAAFFAAVAARQEPDPFGSPVELPFLSALDRNPAKEIDLSTGDDAERLAEMVRLYAWSKKQEGVNAKTAETIKAGILALAGDASLLRFAHGIRVELSQRRVKAHQRAASVSTTVRPYVPDEEPPTAGAGGLKGQMLKSLMGG